MAKAIPTSIENLSPNKTAYTHNAPSTRLMTVMASL